MESIIVQAVQQCVEPWFPSLDVGPEVSTLPPNGVRVAALSEEEAAAVRRRLRLAAPAAAASPASAAESPHAVDVQWPGQAAADTKAFVEQCVTEVRGRGVAASVVDNVHVEPVELPRQWTPPPDAPPCEFEAGCCFRVSLQALWRHHRGVVAGWPSSPTALAAAAADACRGAAGVVAAFSRRQTVYFKVKEAVQGAVWPPPAAASRTPVPVSTTPHPGPPVWERLKRPGCANAWRCGAVASIFVSVTHFLVCCCCSRGQLPALAACVHGARRHCGAHAGSVHGGDGRCPSGLLRSTGRSGRPAMHQRRLQHGQAPHAANAAVVPDLRCVVGIRL